MRAYIQTIHQNIGSFPSVPNNSYERYFFDGDTIINGTYYNKLYVDFNNNPSAPDCLALSGARYVGKAKTHSQHLLQAICYNLYRISIVEIV
jgi:hypothetical protein